MSDLRQSSVALLEKAIDAKIARAKSGNGSTLATVTRVDNDGTTYELIARNEDDTNMTLEVRSKVPVTDELLERSFLLQEKKF